MPSRRTPEAELGRRLAATALELCRVPSVTGEEARLCDLVEERLAGMERRRVGNSLAARRPWTGRPRVGLFGHLDTVPPHAGDPPPALVQGQVRGLGASDMKGGLAVMLALAEDLGDDAACDVAWVFYDREEGPYDRNGLGPLLDGVGWLRELDLALCLEPSRNVVQLGCLGSMHATVRFRGRSAHSARPWQGENAIHAAGPLLAALRERRPVDVEVGGLVFREVISATLATGGSARNVVPGSFELNLNHRFAPGRSADSVRRELEELVGPGAELVVRELCPAGPVPSSNPLLRQLVELSGVRTEAKQAWTDVARLGLAGLDAVNLGPGLPSQAHQAGERVPVRLLVESYGIFRRFLS